MTRGNARSKGQIRQPKAQLGGLRAQKQPTKIARPNTQFVNRQTGGFGKGLSIEGSAIKCNKMFATNVLGEPIILKFDVTRENLSILMNTSAIPKKI